MTTTWSDGSLHILLADDSLTHVTLVRMALEQAAVQCDLRVVNNGAPATRLINSLHGHPKMPPMHLVLLDLHIPGHDDDEILRCLGSTKRKLRLQ